MVTEPNLGKWKGKVPMQKRSGDRGHPRRASQEEQWPMGAQATHHLARVFVLLFLRKRKPRLYALGGREVMGIAKQTSWVFWNNCNFQIMIFKSCFSWTLASENKITGKIMGLGSVGTLSLDDC